jgi:hypothetical protein
MRYPLYVGWFFFIKGLLWLAAPLGFYLMM